jgi:glycosyltransferase involved in cell wall biosynthesis
MAARVLQIDLNAPLAPIPTSERYAALWILVRVGRRPIGWVRVRRAAVGAVVTPDMLHALIAEQIGLQVIDAFRNRQYELPDDADPRTLPSMSVVVCTREHPDVLERQLHSLMRLHYPKYEVVVVDNAPRTDRTRKVCERFARVRYVVEPRKGLDYARNTGWRHARNDVVAYTDDDACVDRGWLLGLGYNYLDPRVKAVTGTTYPYELETPAQECFERYGGMQRGFARKVYRPGTWNAFYPLGSGRFGAGVNMSIRRDTLAAMGGFDNALDVGSIARGCGDLDIFARVIKDGGHLVYEPCAIVWHQHRKTMNQLRRQMFDYGFGFCAYVGKYAMDLELGNQSVKMLRRWSSTWGKKRLRQNLVLALKLRPHFPINLILAEIWGGFLGLRAYKRSVARVHSEAVRQRLVEVERMAAARAAPAAAAESAAAAA